MSQMIDGKEQPSPGISTKDCHSNLNPIPDASKEYVCNRKHREELPHVSFDQYQQWMSTEMRPGSQKDRHLRFGQAFCNDFNVHDEGLYYETKPIVASHTIWSHYIIDGLRYYTVNYNEDGTIN